MKKALKFSLLRIMDGGDGMSISSASILFKLLLSRSLFELNSVSSKLAIYWAAFLSNCWLNRSLN